MLNTPCESQENTKATPVDDHNNNRQGRIEIPLGVVLCGYRLFRFSGGCGR
jgi:hypothetical protein